MSDATETTPQPTPSNPTAVDWAAPDPDETRLPPPGPAPSPTPGDEADGDNAALEGDDDEQPPKPPEKAADDDDPIGEDPDEGADDDEPPEFWSKAKKEQWKKITDPELRAAIKEHVHEVTTGTARKLEENAAKVRAAEESAKQALTEQAAFWQKNGPMIAAIIEGEFAGVNLDELARENPAKWAEVKQGMEARQNWLRGLGAHIQAQQQQVETRQKEAQQAARQTEHGKLAAKFPNEFGTPEAAKRTYEALGGYLAKFGFPAERINNTYEAPIVEIVRKAYKYDQLQAKAKGITTPKPPATPASTTPTRIVPGARNSANPANEAIRQAEERLRTGHKLTPEEGALVFR